MQTSREWLELAKTLPAGYRVRIPCCKSDNSMLVSYDTRRWSAYCFRCGFKDSVPVGRRSIEQIRQDKINLSRIRNSGVALPEDYTLDIPRDAAIWFLKVGIGYDEARRYRIGYSKSIDRIVIPIFDLEAHLIALQCRAIRDYQKPKYVNPEGPETKRAVFWTNTPIPGQPIVVTEDVLSAIKVNLATRMTAASILGTFASDARMLHLLDPGGELLWWLDPDGAGIDGAKTALHKTAMYGGTGRIIVSEKDPKQHSRTEIKEILNDQKTG